MQKLDNETCKDNMGFILGEHMLEVHYDKSKLGIIETPVQQDCDFQTGMTSQGQRKFAKMFDGDCIGKPHCEMDIDIEWFTPICR